MAYLHYLQPMSSLEKTVCFKLLNRPTNKIFIKTDIFIFLVVFLKEPFPKRLEKIVTSDHWHKIDMTSELKIFIISHHNVWYPKSKRNSYA